MRDGFIELIGFTILVAVAFMRQILFPR